VRFSESASVELLCGGPGVRIYMFREILRARIEACIYGMDRTDQTTVRNVERDDRRDFKSEFRVLRFRRSRLF